MVILSKETERLNNSGVMFRGYTTQYQGELAILAVFVDANKDNEENEKVLRKLGYFPGGSYLKRNNTRLYYIPMEELEKRHREELDKSEHVD